MGRFAATIRPVAISPEDPWHHKTGQPAGFASGSNSNQNRDLMTVDKGLPERTLRTHVDFGENLAHAANSASAPSSPIRAQHSPILSGLSGRHGWQLSISIHTRSNAYLQPAQTCPYWQLRPRSAWASSSTPAGCFRCAGAAHEQTWTHPRSQPRPVNDNGMDWLGLHYHQMNPPFNHPVTPIGHWLHAAPRKVTCT
jgi:hypothetical protein